MKIHAKAVLVKQASTNVTDTASTSTVASDDIGVYIYNSRYNICMYVSIVNYTLAHMHICWFLCIYVCIMLRTLSTLICTVPLNYNFIFTCVYMHGTTINLQCHPVMLCGPCFLVAFNVHITYRNMHGTKFTHVGKNLHAYIHACKLLTKYYLKRIQYC